MNLTPRMALGHTLGAALRSLPIRGTSLLGAVLAAVLLVVGPGTGTADAESAGNGTGVGAIIPWYVPPAVTLLAAAVTASAAWLTARWNRAQQRQDRRRERIERSEREAELRAEAELRERRAAGRSSWALYFQRIEDMLLAVGMLQYEAHRRRLHDDDAAVTELTRLRQVAEQYAGQAPGELPTALWELAEAISGIDRHLLPQAAELDRIGQHSSLSAVCLPLFVRAGEQALAADRLAHALKNAHSALHREWGMT